MYGKPEGTESESIPCASSWDAVFVQVFVFMFMFKEELWSDVYDDNVLMDKYEDDTLTDEYGGVDADDAVPGGSSSSFGVLTNITSRDSGTSRSRSSLRRAPWLPKSRAETLRPGLERKCIGTEREEESDANKYDWDNAGNTELVWIAYIKTRIMDA